MRGIDLAIKTDGLKIVLLLRTCPLIPFMLFNYFLGITSIKLKDYLISMSGIIPEFMMCIYIGITLENIEAIWNGDYERNPLEIYSIIFGCVSFVSMVIYITHLTKKTLNN